MPTTGVYSGNDIAWENVDDASSIDLDYESAVAELRESGADQDEIADAIDCYEGGNTLLYGDWIKDEEGSYLPDLTGEYAMIFNVNEHTAQVVFSKTVKYGRLASPCYPGQVDAQVEDPSTPKGRCYIAYYALPVDALRGDE
jgi:hypothetical protein